MLCVHWRMITWYHLKRLMDSGRTACREMLDMRQLPQQNCRVLPSDSKDLSIFKTSYSEHWNRYPEHQV